MLKKKLEVACRKAILQSDGRNRRCKFCVHRKWTEIKGCNGEFLCSDWRCEIIGLNNSRRHSVAADHVCDHFKQEKI